MRESQPGAGGAWTLPAPKERPGDGRGRCEKMGEGNLSNAAPALRLAAPSPRLCGFGTTLCDKVPPDPFEKATALYSAGSGEDGRLPLLPSPAAPPPQLQTHRPQGQRLPSSPAPSRPEDLAEERAPDKAGNAWQILDARVLPGNPRRKDARVAFPRNALPSLVSPKPASSLHAVPEMVGWAAYHFHPVTLPILPSPLATSLCNPPSPAN